MAAPEDPPFLTEEELDALYERNPVEAMRISRRQAQWQRELDAGARADPNAPMPTLDQVVEVLAKARQVLAMDGGDLEVVEISGSIVRVRMKGNCAGCPRSALDLKHVVEKAVRGRFPAVAKVENVF